MNRASEQADSRYRLRVKGVTLDTLSQRVAKIYGLEKEQGAVAGKRPHRDHARSVPAFWVDLGPGLTATEVGAYPDLVILAVSRAVNMGQAFVADGALVLDESECAKPTPSPFSQVYLSKTRLKRLKSGVRFMLKYKKFRPLIAMFGSTSGPFLYLSVGRISEA